MFDMLQLVDGIRDLIWDVTGNHCLNVGNLNDKLKHVVHLCRTFNSDIHVGHSFDLVERDVPDWILLPILVIEMPPLRLIDGEALRLHCVAQQLAVPTLERSSTWIVRV